jgi:hypothetical protein
VRIFSALWTNAWLKTYRLLTGAPENDLHFTPLVLGGPVGVLELYNLIQGCLVLPMQLLYFLLISADLVPKSWYFPLVVRQRGPFSTEITPSTNCCNRETWASITAVRDMGDDGE